jgi:hypothetical protein
VTTTGSAPRPDIVTQDHREATCKAPSNHPEFAEFLVACGIDSMSVTPSSFIAAKQRVMQAEARSAPEASMPTMLSLMRFDVHQRI